MRLAGRALAFVVYALLNIDRWDWTRVGEVTRAAVKPLRQGALWIPRRYTAILGTVAVGLTPVWLWLIWDLFREVINLIDALGTETGAEVRRNIAYALGVTTAALAGLVAAPLVLIRAWVAERHTRTAEEGLITDRFTKAVEQLGAEKTVKRREFKPRYRVNDDGDWLRDEDGNPSPAERPDGTPLGEWETFEESVPNLEVRLGAIYALERIAQDSERDHIPIMETLCAYVRENAVGYGPPEEPMMNRPRVDIKAVVDVLSRRTAERIEHERQRGFMLDLTYSDFRARDMRGLHLERASFSYANLTNAYFIYARLERALFRFTELNGADLSGAKLNHADLTAAELQEANLERSQLEGANLRLASLTEANLKSANLNTANLAHARLTRANLRSVNLASVRNLRQQQIDLAFGDCDTVLPDGIDVPHHWAEEPWNSYLPDAKYKAWLEARAPAGKPRADRA